jgi:hypothetical protein
VAESATVLDQAFSQPAARSELLALVERGTEAMSRFTAQILTLTESSHTPNCPTSAYDRQSLAPVLDDLIGLLSRYDARASHLARDCADLLESALGGQYEYFRHQIAVFDYDGALRTLRAATGATQANEYARGAAPAA